MNHTISVTLSSPLELYDITHSRLSTSPPLSPRPQSEINLLHAYTYQGSQDEIFSLARKANDFLITVIMGLQKQTFALLLGACANFVAATPSASSVGSDLQILLHNDLYGVYPNRML